MRLTTFVLAWVLAAPVLASAQAPGAPPIVNGRLEPRAGADLAAAIAALPSGPSEVAWIGYSVPSEGRGNRCCWTSAAEAGMCCQGCRLEGDGGKGAVPLVPPAGLPVPLEPDHGRVAVLVRVAAGTVDRIRVFSPTCTLDAGGRAVYWLSAVTPDASAAWLNGHVGDDSRRLADDALMTLAAHAAPRALDYMLAHARTGGTARLRGQALFWLAQRAGERAVGAITEAIDRDPDTDVKRKAVFALSQLPAGEGVPRLIDVARAHSNSAVRKQAFFWLGQSNDPRALAFFAEVLKR